MGSKKIQKKSYEHKFREMVKESGTSGLGVWCPICEDYIVTPNETINPCQSVEDMVVEHYEAFHTAEEIEKYNSVVDNT